MLAANNTETVARVVLDLQRYQDVVGGWLCTIGDHKMIEDLRRDLDEFLVAIVENISWLESELKGQLVTDHTAQWAVDTRTAKYETFLVFKHIAGPIIESIATAKRRKVEASQPSQNEPGVGANAAEPNEQGVTSGGSISSSDSEPGDEISQAWGRIIKSDEFLIASTVWD